MTKREKIISCIQEGRGVLGIEFGSTRIKAVLIDETIIPLQRATMNGRIVWKTVSGPTVWRRFGKGCRTATPNLRKM